MLYVYGPLLPARILEEIIFWKTQEKEHTEVIKGIVPALEEPYVKLLDEWAVVFGAAEQAARRLLEVSLGPPRADTPGLPAIPDSLFTPPAASPANSSASSTLCGKPALRLKPSPWPA